MYRSQTVLFNEYSFIYLYTSNRSFFLLRNNGQGPEIISLF